MTSLTCDKSGAIHGLELVKAAAVNNAGNDLADIKLLLEVGTDNAVQIFRGEQGFFGCGEGDLRKFFFPSEMGVSTTQQRRISGLISISILALTGTVRG